MSAERLRAMLSDTWEQKQAWDRANEADARLAALAPDAIALLASEEFALLLRWVAILYREVEDGGRANDEMVPIRASDLYNLGQAAEPVRAALDALCGDDQ